MPTEIDIIKRVLQGEVDAFRYFIDTYKDMAFTLVMGMLQDESIAEDVVQTSFIKAFKNLKQFKMKSKFSTWFYTIVVNEARIQLRKNRSNVKILEIENIHETDLFEENPALSNLHRSDQQRIIDIALRKSTTDESS